MSKQLLMELTLVVARRYYKTKSRKEKTKILDEYCSNTELNRQYVFEKLKKVFYGDKTPKKRGRKPKYSKRIKGVLTEIWEVFTVCAERLKPFIPEAISVLERNNHIHLSNEEKKLLCSMSEATIKRIISEYKQRVHGKFSFSTTKPGSLLKKNIPIQTICWDKSLAGFCEIDLVAHCGGSLSGDFIYTLQFVDIKTTWTERKAVMGKSQNNVFQRIKQVRKLLPFDLKGIDSDNGSEFINHQLVKYCNKENIAFTRSRPYMSKDNAHIEQKNWTLVRQVLGYHRFDTHEQLHRLNDLYDNELRLFINFFQPTMKLVEKMKIGSRYKRKYDTPKTPYQRVMLCPDIPQIYKDNLTSLYLSLDPISLKRSIKKKVLNIVSLSSGF